MIGQKGGLAANLEADTKVYYETWQLSMSPACMQHLLNMLEPQIHLYTATEVMNFINDLRSRLQRIAVGDRMAPLGDVSGK